MATMLGAGVTAALLASGLAADNPSPSAGAVPAGTGDPGGEAAGDALMSNVLLQLERRERIAASVLLQSTLDGRQLELGGPEFISRYYQQWDANREKLSVCWELRGHLDGAPVHWKQVSDGDRLWTEQVTPAGRRIARVDLRQLRRELDGPPVALESLPAGQAGAIPIQMDLLSERGGLPTLIAALCENFHFCAPVNLRLAEVPVYGIIGQWKPKQLARLVPDTASDSGAAQPSNGANSLPARIPASVMLLVGQDDMFPYIIEFRSAQATTPTAPGDMSQFQIRPQSLLLLHLYERSYSFDSEPGRFQYSPGGAEWVDLTASRLAARRGSQDGAASRSAATTAAP